MLSHCHDCHDAVVTVSKYWGIESCRHLIPYNVASFCRVKANRGSNTLSQRTGKRMCCEQIVSTGFKESVSFWFVVSVWDTFETWTYSSWTAFWFELIGKASPPDSLGERSPTTVREASQRKTVLIEDWMSSPSFDFSLKQQFVN